MAPLLQTMIRKNRSNKTTQLFLEVVTMGKSVQNPKKHIISCRVNEVEMEVLQHMTEEFGTSISELLRQSVFQLCDQQEETHRAA